MRLTKLELHGFKSFADATTLAFEPGVTAIVGPNGCGKSNVSDAVRWVLGEQRARALRGVKMDEVIFQGSSARRPVSVAEVSLHFDNDDSALPVAYREVVVTRRLSRSGDSDYLLNRAPCRLRDIHDLMRGTGLGADAGVVIESRMVDALLSDRPDERRELFEEAAGVGFYRDRRRTTERRLEETSVDLARLDDLLSEVQTQVRSLSRQRRRAERHAELTVRLRALELTLATRELASARAELASLDAVLASLVEREPGTHRSAAEAEHQRSVAHHERASAEGRRAEFARLVATQHEGIANLRGEIAVAEERQRNAVARRQRAEDERRAGEVAGGRVRAERAAAASERASLERDLRAAEAALTEAMAREEQARREVAGARAALDAGETNARALRDNVARHEREYASAEREHAEVTARLEALSVERARLGDRLASARRDAQSAAEGLAGAGAAAEQAADELADGESNLRRALAADADARHSVAQHDEAVAALDARVNALETLARDRVGLAPAAAHLLRDRERFGDGAILGPLSDYITAGTGDAEVIERFLGPTVHAMLVRDRAAADSVREWHREVDPGPLLLLPLDAAGGDAGAAPASRPAADSLVSRVTPAERASRWVRTLLLGAHDLGDGVAFEDGRGAIWLPGSEEGPGPLRRQAELVDLKSQLDQTRVTRDLTSASAHAVRRVLETAQTRASAAADKAADAVRSVRTHEDRNADAERILQRAERDLRDADAMTATLTERAAVLANRIEAIAIEVGSAAITAAECESGVSGQRRALAATEETNDAARDARTACQVARAQVQTREQIIQDRERRLSEEHASAAGRLEALETELLTLSSADGALAEQIATWRADLSARQASLNDGVGRLDDAEADVRAADSALANAEQALDTARHAGSELSAEIHRTELRRTELTGHERAVRERVEREWGRSWSSLMADLEPVDGPDDALRTEAADLREQLTALGPVNPLAIEEHDEEAKRLTFISAQREDLAKARASLQQAIREIDATAKELFVATFAQVRENFRRIFMVLFGGGECDLRLENPDAPLDCDIEIHASPRGKRTQRIHLLSSGERSLVALSLLFGIFLAKPSPFCLLDEVDAPLDDQNIGRFVRMLNEFKTRTQFIVITHNPRTTTEAADAVYGVTMQEPGVSSLVSVRLRGPADIDRPSRGAPDIETEIALHSA